MKRKKISARVKSIYNKFKMKPLFDDSEFYEDKTEKDIRNSSEEEIDGLVKELKNN